jgi:hypothetical protein
MVPAPSIAAAIRRRKAGRLTIFSPFLTKEPNAEVNAIHPKPMPVILTTQGEINASLTADGDAALTPQRTLPYGALMIVARGYRTGDPPAQPFPEPRGASPRPPLLRLPPQMLTDF